MSDWGRIVRGLVAVCIVVLLVGILVVGFAALSTMLSAVFPGLSEPDVVVMVLPLAAVLGCAFFVGFTWRRS